MANVPVLSTAQGGQRDVGREFRDSLPLLDVLHADQFEGDNFNPELIEKTEEDFYRGAPPSWLNFHISEQATLDGTGTLFVKRDGYETLKKQIQEKRKLPGISTVKLFHQSGCGGTTMAMQVLWDLRKTFRCAALTGSTSDITEVAKEVIELFTAGNRGHQNTVLLLLNDEQILDNLQSSIIRMIAEKNMVTKRPVVIFLNCVRKESVLKSNYVVLQRELSDAEKQRFSEKKNELVKKYGNKTKQFHGFKIIQTNFSLTYIKEACTVFKSVQKAKRPLKAQLAAFLSLLNAYVPGSYLLESQCLAFLRIGGSINGDLAVEELMQPFSHLIISFQQDVTAERKVRMAHPMIAKRCTELMAAGGVTRSDTARNLLNSFYSNDEDTDEFPQYLLSFVKDMLTRRETKTEENPVGGSDSKEDKERFSRLVLDIQKEEGRTQSASVLEVATKKFHGNPFFPQALARFCCIEIKDYKQAEIWAETAKQRDPQNSFIADTLGQVHKNHLKSKGGPASQREILELAKRAIEAFKHEEELAENEQGMDMKDYGFTKVSTVFNVSGQLGFLQVCNILYDRLVRQNETWKSVLTKRVSLKSALENLGDTKLYNFNDLINSLRGEVQKKFDFFDKYLTYSKLSIEKNDPNYISRDASECHRKYVGDLPPRDTLQNIDQLMEILQQKQAAGVLACFDRGNTKSEIQEITSMWRKMCSSTNQGTAVVNYILAHIMSVNTGVTPPCKRKPFTAFRQIMPLNIQDPPEEHMLALLLCWPSASEDELELDQLIQRMRLSYEIAYKKYFRSRYLRPLFFIGKEEGLNRIVHRKVLERLLSEESQDTAPDWTHNWRHENIFENPKVQEILRKVEGEVQNCRVYANVRDTKIEVEVHLEKMLWRPRRVSFYLGFTIRGPVAFGIQTETPDQGMDSSGLSGGAVVPSFLHYSCSSGMKWLLFVSLPLLVSVYQHFVDVHRIALIDRVKDTKHILDKLLDMKIISSETNDDLRAITKLGAGSRLGQELPAGRTVVFRGRPISVSENQPQKLPATWIREVHEPGDQTERPHVPTDGTGSVRSEAA
ncbi:sterile alpha motif domain-containing protein 9-like [Cololabis saira]|uniref:sterile alpha motif domain-containing protein 9-like n=1 Tax=Cololabis saira TaxID=129043 RepID=UPI002AD4D30F|nr:sterile alpha motif domain-containing protein 9-like [Cololabis saira]